MAYKACLALIAAGRTDGLEVKVEKLYANSRITIIEYDDLIKKLREVIA